MTRCIVCNRPLKTLRSVALYGERDGVTNWQDGPYGMDCAAHVALRRWKSGLMTYRKAPGTPGWLRSAYRFPDARFGSPGAGS